MRGKHNIDVLPVGKNPSPLEFHHFPTKHQAVIWRNWELAPVKTLADVLKTTAAKIILAAEEMQLRVPPLVDKKWLERGYITIIRNNWHLLTYEQILQLLGWTPERLAYTLHEDDFLWHKLGSLKPNSQTVYYRPLTADEAERTKELKKTIKKHFPSALKITGEKPFAFLDQFHNFNERDNQNPANDRYNNFDLRLTYSYAAVYGDPLLDPKLDPYPERLLASYRNYGINGIWLQGVLYTLVPWEAAPKLSVGYEKRLESLRRLTNRAARHGIGVYLYLNEPRPMPLKFFERYPEWKGAEYPESGRANLCTSQKPILSFLENATTRLFKEVPALAGVFTITMSENPTNCYSKGQVKQCPRCSRRPAEEVIAEVNNAIERGVHRSKPEARVIVWNWAWGPEWEHAAIDLLPDNVELMCTSEWGLPTNIGGIKGSVVDYSISQVGPSARSQKMWAHAHKRGLKTVAKIQVNNTWECSAVPYIPTPDLVEKHLQNLTEAGVGGLMTNWTLGGYPGGNMELFKKTPLESARDFGHKAAPYVRRAQKLLSRAFTEFPFHVGVLYVAPQNTGPANLLYENPTNYRATMVGFPYDDLDAWRSIYRREIFEKQFYKLASGWKKGTIQLQKAFTLPGTRNKNKLEELLRIAAAIYCHFRTVYLQAGFVRLRDTAKNGEILKIIGEELELAKTLHALMTKDSRIGFEASNHYAYTANTLKEKVLNCEYLRRLYLDKSNNRKE